MFRNRRRALTGALVLLLATHAVAAEYRFVNIADTRGPFESFDFLAQAVSDNGQVAFIGSQGGVAGTYVGDGTSTTNIVPDFSPPLGFNGGGAQALNTSGVAVGGIGCCFPVETKVLLYEATGTRTIAEATGGTTFTRWLSADDINNNGAVAIRRYQTSSGLEEFSITRWFDGTTTTLVETTEGFNSVDSTRLNELGDVAFRGSKQVGEYTYYRTDGTTLTLIADSSGPLNIPFAPPTGLAVNDSGAVAFWSRLDAGGEGIFIGDGGPLTTVAIADPTTPFFDLMWNDSIDINNQGTVAFFAELWDGRRGIFTGPDAENDKVVAHGDLLFGQRVNGIGRPHLNERGDIAFWFSVRDPKVSGGEWYGIALALAPAILATWNIDADGNWSAADNWTGGVPNAAGARAVFGSVITQPRTVTVDIAVTVGRIDFDSANAYTIEGTSGLTLDATDGAAEINVTGGSHTISAPVTLAGNTVVTVSPTASNLSITGGLNAAAVSLTKAGAGTLTVSHLRAAQLSIDGGKLVLAPGPGAPGPSASIVGALSIAGDAAPTTTLDLTNNAVVLDYSGASPIATIRQQILAGRGGPGLGASWNGSGITSSAAAAANATEQESRSIGYAENSALPLGAYTDFRGQSVDDSSVLMAFTRTADANLDGVVNDDDVTIVGATYAPGVPQAHWALGDFDYNGFVDDDDATLLGVFYNPSAAPIGIGTPAETVQSTAVPEPATLALVAFAAAMLLAAFRTGRRGRERRLVQLNLNR